jgi:hypothetical protein
MKGLNRESGVVDANVTQIVLAFCFTGQGAGESEGRGESRRMTAPETRAQDTNSQPSVTYTQGQMPLAGESRQSPAWLDASPSSSSLHATQSWPGCAPSGKHLLGVSDVSSTETSRGVKRMSEDSRPGDKLADGPSPSATVQVGLRAVWAAPACWLHHWAVGFAKLLCAVMLIRGTLLHQQLNNDTHSNESAAPRQPLRSSPAMPMSQRPFASHPAGPPPGTFSYPPRPQYITQPMGMPHFTNHPPYVAGFLSWVRLCSAFAALFDASLKSRATHICSNGQGPAFVYRMPPHPHTFTARTLSYPDTRHGNAPGYHGYSYPAASPHYPHQAVCFVAWRLPIMARLTQLHDSSFSLQAHQWSYPAAPVEQENPLDGVKPHYALALLPLAHVLGSEHSSMARPLVA